MSPNKTVSDNLKWATNLLKNSGINSARLDSLILMEQVTSMDRAELLAHDDLILGKKQNNLFNKLVTQRAERIPITQLTNSCQFYGRRFYINEFVMSPRPETELMIDIFLNLIKSHKLLKNTRNIMVADVGTGSGAIGITVKKEVPEYTVDLIDIDQKALKIAKINVVLHTIGINVIQNNLIADLDTEYQIILCNLPYVPDEFEINAEAQHEPKLAIFGGKDGLDVYRELFSQLLNVKNKPLLILTESFSQSHKELQHIASKASYSEILSKDFIQVFQLK